MKILICVGGMPFATPTIFFGSLIAGLRASQVTLLTVIGDVGKQAVADAALGQARVVMDAPVTAVKVRQGAPVEEIIQESREGNYDMIVVGARVVTGLFEMFLHSVTRQITKQAGISVLVVKEPRSSLERILVCTGGRQINRAVVKVGGRLAQISGAQVKLLHVADPVPSMYTGLDAMEETVTELVQSNTPIARHLRWGAEVLAGYEVTAELALRRGMAVDEILREAHQYDSDLIVIGAQVEKTTWLNELLMSTVTPQVVDRAPCSVLVVRRELPGLRGRRRTADG